ncbi:MAG: ribose 5-phosphate isomerase B [Thermodesulfovibrionales bacterium]|nr:ribose 5-phosphate isomerase B [Thermodesulfovibrionales bacterium]
MKIAIASDHAGIEMKSTFVSLISEFGHHCVDFGPQDIESVDYPDFAQKVAKEVSEGNFDRGILICGTGIGMAITANKFKNIRAALCNDLYSAKMSRFHNDANIMTIGGRIVGKDLAKEILKVWLNTEFEGGRHNRRLIKIKSIEEKIR